MKWSQVLKILVSLVLVVILLRMVDLAEIGQVLRSVNLPLFLAAVVVGHLDRALQAGKWWLLVRSSGVHLGYGAALSNTYAGNFAGLFLPSGVGGDVVRVVLLRELRLPLEEVIASIVVERAFGLLALAATAAAAVGVAHYSGIPMPDGLVGAILLGLGGMLVLMAASFRLGVDGLIEWITKVGARFKLGEKLGGLTEAYRRYGKRKGAVVSYFFLSILEVLAMCVVFTLTAWSLGIEVPALAMLVVVPVTLVGHRLPVSINGIGVQEGLLGWFFSALGLGLEQAIALGLAMRVIDLAILFPGAFLWMNFRRRQAEAEPAA